MVKKCKCGKKATVFTSTGAFCFDHAPAIHAGEKVRIVWEGVLPG